jgi:transcriptional regulator with XRE-family HTH domain
MSAGKRRRTMQPPTTVAGVLAFARELKGLTLREVEKATNVSNGVISQIETGRIRDPSFALVVRLADFYGLSIERAADALRMERARK